MQMQTPASDDMCLRRACGIRKREERKYDNELGERVHGWLAISEL